MIDFTVPENDQTVYEITTSSGNHYFVRCPGQTFYVDDETPIIPVFAFLLLDENKEQAVMLKNLECITKITPRPDLPIGQSRPISMTSLFCREYNAGAQGFVITDLQ